MMERFEMRHGLELWPDSGPYDFPQTGPARKCNADDDHCPFGVTDIKRDVDKCPIHARPVDRTHLLGSAFIAAMMLSLMLSTIVSIISTPALIRHADGSPHETITLATVLRDVTFRGGFVEVGERPRWTEVLL